MTPLLTFTVIGKPEPRGSKTAGRRKDGGTFYRDANPASYAWMALVEMVARIEMRDLGAEPVKAPIRLDVTFYLERPKKHFGKDGLTAAGLSRPYPTVKPDRGKYLRAIEDALTGVVYVDDAQVVSGLVEKRYGAPARAEIAVYVLEGAASLDGYLLEPTAPFGAHP